MNIEEKLSRGFELLQEKVQAFSEAFDGVESNGY